MSRAAPYAELRVVRLLTIGTGASCVTMMALRRLLFWEPRVEPEWFRLMVIASLCLPVALACAAPRLGLPALRRGNAVAALATLLLLVAAVPINLWLPEERQQVPWVLTTSGVAATSALLAWGRRAAWCVLAASTLLVQAGRAGTTGFELVAAANDVHALLTGTAIVVLCGLLLAATREFDRAAAATQETAVRRGAAAARRAVRERIGSLVHDEVLATLSLASYDGGPRLAKAVARQACRARRLIADLAAPRHREPVPVSRLVEQLRALATVDAAAVSFAAAVDARTQVPADVAAALAGATRQAVVNSVVHAGRAATLRVRVDGDADRIAVEVSDDGVGFEVAAVPPTRLGVSVSIVGRMSALSGGSAAVESRPGAGTRVTLEWRREPADSVAGLVVAPPRIGDGRRVRGSVLLLVSVFCLGQLALAAIDVAADRRAPVWALLGLVGFWFGLAALGWRRLVRPGRARTAVVLATVVATAALAWVPALSGRVDYTDLWYLTGAAYVLLALAVRGRPGAGLLGVGLSTAIVVVALVTARPESTEAGAAIARPLVIVGFGAFFTVLIRRTQASTARLRAVDLAHLHASAWEESRTAELAERSRQLDELVGRQLERLAAAPSLDDAARRDCAALEGRLRDQYRGGRLARPPLVEAAMAARARGVDVVFLDDADHDLDEDQLDDIARWMRCELDRVREGRFTGRILPAGRAALASAVAGEESTLFRG